jgi:ubiquinol-cytochrome c reductase cytochrome c subunit
MTLRRLLAPALLLVLALATSFLLFGGEITRPPRPGAPAAGAVLTSASHLSVAQMIARGQVLFEENCSTCHASNAEGSARGPNLVGLGAATIDFWVSTGRMPLADPSAQPIEKPSRFTRLQQLEIVRYVTSLGPGGPGIPHIDLAHASISEGFSLFVLNCAPCHTVTGSGDALASGYYAPSLHAADALQVAEAIRTGPSNMPRFGPGTLSHQQMEDIVDYVVHGIQHPADPGGIGLGGVGPVAEGFVGLFVGVGGCLLVALWIGDRARGDGGRGHGEDGRAEEGTHA